MKLISFFLAAVLTAFAFASAASAATREDFRGRWSRDCGNGLICHVDVDDTKDRRIVEIAFSVEGRGEPCRWSVNAVFNPEFNGPVAMDPYGNYGFYLTIMKDGRLYSSGTMLQICADLPRDQYYTADVPAEVDSANIYDHNGSAVRVDPRSGIISYDYPKRSIAGTVRPGTVLFQANAPWNPDDDNAVVSGMAYVFKKGCAPAPYVVQGHHQGWHTLVLMGAAPVREKHGCRIVDYRMNGNSVLKFAVIGD